MDRINALNPNRAADSRVRTAPSTNNNRNRPVMPSPLERPVRNAVDLTDRTLVRPVEGITAPVIDLIENLTNSSEFTDGEKSLLEKFQSLESLQTSNFESKFSKLLTPFMSKDTKEHKANEAKKVNSLKKEINTLGESLLEQKEWARFHSVGSASTYY